MNHNQASCLNEQSGTLDGRSSGLPAERSNQVSGVQEVQGATGTGTTNSSQICQPPQTGNVQQEPHIPEEEDEEISDESTDTTTCTPSEREDVQGASETMAANNSGLSVLPQQSGGVQPELGGARGADEEVEDTESMKRITASNSALENERASETVEGRSDISVSNQQTGCDQQELRGGIREENQMGGSSGSPVERSRPLFRVEEVQGASGTGTTNSSEICQPPQTGNVRQQLPIPEEEDQAEDPRNNNNRVRRITQLETQLQKISAEMRELETRIEDHELTIQELKVQSVRMAISLRNRGQQDCSLVFPEPMGVSNESAAERSSTPSGVEEVEGASDTGAMNSSEICQPHQTGSVQPGPRIREDEDQAEDPRNNNNHVRRITQLETQLQKMSAEMRELETRIEDHELTIQELKVQSVRMAISLRNRGQQDCSLVFPEPMIPFKDEG